MCLAILHPSASPTLIEYSTAFLFITGSTPGNPSTTGIHLRIGLAAKPVGGAGEHLALGGKLDVNFTTPTSGPPQTRCDIMVVTGFTPNANGITPVFRSDIIRGKPRASKRRIAPLFWIRLLAEVPAKSLLRISDSDVKLRIVNTPLPASLSLSIAKRPGRLSGQHTGRTDVPLTETGRGGRSRWPPPCRHAFHRKLWTSPSQRARQTCALAGLGGDAIIDPELPEWIMENMRA